MATVAAYAYITPEEYLDLEREGTTKNEYRDGDIFAMAGASRAHVLITANIAGELRSRLKGRTCEVYPIDMRVRVRQTTLFTYPDVVVVCGEPRFEDDVFDTLLNPTLIVEVLSPSTEAYDRGEKFARFRQLASLREYVLVAQKEVHVERYLRQGTQWVPSEFRSLDDVLRLLSINCELPLREIYERVTFPNSGAQPRLDIL